MPWFPDFANAVELVRQQTRAAGRADPVGQYLAALDGGDPRALEDAWPGTVVVQDPRVGEVRGHRHLRDFVRRSKALLDGMHTRVEAVSSTVAGDRAVVELLAHVTSADGRQVDWPVAVVAERPDEESVVFRSYFSQLPVVGTHPVRPPILPAGATHLDGIVGDYLTALAAGDTEATIKTFTPYGYLREPIGPSATHRGPAELREYFQSCFRDGGIGLQQCAVTDDGVRCAVEYNCLSWGGRQVPPQAGMAIHERDADGLLAAVRVYDDVAPLP